MRTVLAFLVCTSCSATPRVEVDATLPGDGSPDSAMVSHPAMPQVLSRGGPVLAAPRVIPVSFGSDPIAGDIQSFLHALASNSYWSAISAEYGVGELTVGTPVVLTDPAPAAFTVETAYQWVRTQLDGNHPAWGTPDANTLYLIYPPATTKLGDAALPDFCTNAFGGGGFHDSAVAANGVEVAFAFAARCSKNLNPGYSDLDVYSATMSHEIIEAATDPLESRPAYLWPDNGAWAVPTYGEVADLCEIAPDNEYRAPGMPSVVQRSWSNAAARAGHDPCVPSIAMPYFTSAPVLDDTVTFKFHGVDETSPGTRIAVGATRTIELDLFSDGPVDPWTITASDWATLVGDAPALELSLDHSTGGPGDRLHLTIHVLRTDPSFHGELFVIASTHAGSVRSYWFGMIVN